MLRDDFPEALYPLWMLQNNARRQIGQHVEGEMTHAAWARDQLVFPTVTDDRLLKALRDMGHVSSPSASSIITVTSLDANMRGQQHTKMDGAIVRPSLVILDDPQTRQPKAVHYIAGITFQLLLAALAFSLNSLRPQ